ncbi:MAG: hypothetical protein AAB307_00080, partial [Deltaproteobacteria bacterium]
RLVQVTRDSCKKIFFSHSHSIDIVKKPYDTVKNLYTFTVQKGLLIKKKQVKQIDIKHKNKAWKLLSSIQSKIRYLPFIYLGSRPRP